MTTLFSRARKLDAHGQVDDFWMLVEGNSIISVGSGPQHPPADFQVDVAGRRLVPGFLDLHGHGGGGFAFDDGGEHLVRALATHRAHGTTRSVVSLVANPPAELRASLAAIADLARSDPLVLGAHLEGPFMAVGRRGAHNAQFLLEPDPALLEELLNSARGTLRQITIAPELVGAMESIDVLVEAGVVVAIGHSYADFAIAQEAFDRGARLLTHAFNAMSGIHHRAPGPVVAAFEDARVSLELILDGEHVHPDVAALTFRSAPGRVALVTDAMAAAGSTDGDYRLGSLNVAVRDGTALLRGTTTIAGSTLTQDRALRVAITRAHIPAVDAVAALTLTPAKVLGIEHRHGLLAPGFVADAVLLNSAWEVDEVWADGRRIAQR
ncbi:N-acetylglucosamine 6-phosphate deacetylase [Glaciihabitans tibetensis]|uniref:N-acetylglucosamine 6-phosphate deacetylase n=1 Tax=Glaciihabitans tibetensis TaxID=1266600 RepID=A0A2T0VBT8_9MICO|nr:N-acetylglucosamine-6-phosphate deacetylase [Glaciihabitans tibetensis]PRY67649.1 N-acetylglucosamine 6-phosphate deacetylase [Glaciihabitans tibetensis]